MSLSEEEIRINLETVTDRIKVAAASANRSAANIKLVVVSKRQPVEVIVKAAKAGAVRFGENYAEEVEAKQESLAGFPALQWHMIGHIQSRKAKIVASRFDFIHSLDSIDLAQKLNRNLAEKKASLPVLLEMNVSSEASKGGWPAWDQEDWDRLKPEIESVLACQSLKVCGLMTMPPLYSDSREVRPFFRRLANLRDFLAANFPAVEWNELSMGTSDDYEIGVQEGATFVRIGQAILGSRP